MNPLDRLRYHVTGAIERGEATAIAGRPLNRIAGRWGMVWRKQFVPGAILDGINLWDRLEFVDRWHCAQWLKGVRRNIRQGSLEWRFSGRPTTAKVIGGAR